MAGFTPALRQGSAFQGAMSTRPTSRSVTGLKMADAWVRVVPSDSVAAGAQADRLVAGAGAFVSSCACLQRRKGAEQREDAALLRSILNNCSSPSAVAAVR